MFGVETKPRVPAFRGLAAVGGLAMMAVGCGALLGADWSTTLREGDAPPDSSAVTVIADAAPGDDATLADSANASRDAGESGRLFPPGTAALRLGPDDVSVTLTRAFFVDPYEVTVERFKAWVDAGQPAPCAGPCSLDPGGPYEQKMIWDVAWAPLVSAKAFHGLGCRSSVDHTDTSPSKFATFDRVGGSVMPINCVSWPQAVAFCAWEGKRLPTRVEWTYVASGQGRSLYPWGNSPPSRCTQAIWRSGAGAPDFNGCGFPRPVGSAPAGAAPQQVFDLAGSLREWSWDGFEMFFDPLLEADHAADPRQGSDRSALGGGWSSGVDELPASSFVSLASGTSRSDLGFRCAQTKL